jgi:hypothetical protein
LKEGDPGGYGPKTGRSAVEDEDVDGGKIILNGIVCFVFRYLTSNMTVLIMFGNTYFEHTVFMHCAVRSFCTECVCQSRCLCKTRVAFGAN